MSDDNPLRHLAAAFVHYMLGAQLGRRGRGNINGLIANGANPLYGKRSALRDALAGRDTTDPSFGAIPVAESKHAAAFAGAPELVWDADWTTDATAIRHAIVEVAGLSRDRGDVFCGCVKIKVPRHRAKFLIRWPHDRWDL